MPTPIDFYFDFSSPYGYLAAERIAALAARHERALQWHPMLLGVVFKNTGSQALMTVPIKGAYAWRDIARCARLANVAYRQPTRFPLSTQIAARAMLWINQQYDDATAIAFALAIYRALFVDDLDISLKAEVLRCAAAVGVASAPLDAALETLEVKDCLKNTVAQAIERGVFGSPFMLVDDQAFWGFDRFSHLEHYLSTGSL